MARSAFRKLVLPLVLLSVSACAVQTTVPEDLDSGAAPHRFTQKAINGLSPAGPEQGIQGALEACKTGNWESVLLISGRVIDQYPNTAWYKRALFLVEEALIKLDRDTEAEAAMLRVQAEYPELADYAVSILAEYDYSRGRYTRAAALYQHLTDHYAKSSLVPKSAFRRAQALSEAGAYPQAAEAFERFLEDSPRSEFAPAAGLGLARALLAEGEVSRAVRSYQEVWIRYPGEPADQDVEKALAELRAKGAGMPELTPDELFERGRNLSWSGQHEKAIASFGKLLEKEPDSPHRAEALFRIGIAAYNLGRRTESAAVLEKMAIAFPRHALTPEALNWLGKAYSKLGAWDRGVQAFQKILDRYPDSEWTDDALFLIGNIYREAGDTKKALLFYGRLADEYPDSKFADSAIWWRAWSWYNAGDYQKTEQTLQQLVDRYPRSFLVSQARYWQGRTSEKRGDPQRAAIYYDRVLKKGLYTYYGYRAAERRAALRIADALDTAEAPADNSAACEDATCMEDPLRATEGDDGPPVWTEETRQLLAKELSYKKTLELMHLDLKKEAAAELWYLQERLPRKRGALIGLSKAFFELGDYYRSILIILRNYERYLETPSNNTPEDLWRLAYPQGYWESVLSYARKYGQDPYFIAAIIRAESQFHTEALSPVGARGLMQVMPATGAWIARSISIRGFNSAKLFDADMGINIGTWYIGYLMKKLKGDHLLVAAAYNAGSDAVAAWVGKNGYSKDRDAFVESIPFSETRGYVKKVLRNYGEYKRIYGRSQDAVPLPAAVRRSNAIGFVRADVLDEFRNDFGYMSMELKP